LLSDEDWVIREWSALGLGALGDVRAIEPLLQSFSDEDESVRGCIAVALGDLGDNMAVEALLDALGDESWSVRRSAALALGARWVWLKPSFIYFFTLQIKRV
jgi:HEAT repeat protein